VFAIHPELDRLARLGIDPELAEPLGGGLRVGVHLADPVSDLLVIKLPGVHLSEEELG